MSTLLVHRKSRNTTNYQLPTTNREAKGFTLVELLVVITILAILSTIGLTVFGGVQKSARDAKRRADLKSIANALEIYKARSSDGLYPKTGTVCSNSTSSPWIPGLDSNYMTTLPTDPSQTTAGISGGQTTGVSYNESGYTYCYWSGENYYTDQGNYFMLTTRPENPSADDLKSKCTVGSLVYGSNNATGLTNQNYIYPNNLFVCSQQ